MATRRKIDGDKVEHGEVLGVTYDRPYRWFWNPYGVKAWLPADPVQMSLWMEAGWSLHKPAKPLAALKTQKMRDGSVYEYADATNEPTDAEWKRFNRDPSQPVATGPTATYYTREGNALANLPADPQSMADYLAAGLTLDPPNKATGDVVQLKVARAR